MSMRRALGVSSISLLATFAACGRSGEPAVREPLPSSSLSPSETSGVPAGSSVVGSSDPTPSSMPPLADDRADLKISIEIAIRMLERKEHRGFLVEFVAPEDREKMAKKGGLDAVVADFAAEKAERLLDALRLLRSLTPTFDGPRAIFELKPGKKLRWVKVDGKWYIEN